MNCRNCKQKLKEIPIGGFDAFSFLTPIKPMFCENKECQEYGYVTVVGFPEEITPNHSSNE